MESPRSSLRRSSKVPLVIALVALGAAGYWASRRFGSRTEAPETPSAPAAAPGDEPAARAGAPADVRDLGANIGEEEVRALADTVSPSELYRRTLAQGDVARRAAVLIDNLAQGASPRRQLEPLRPERPFAVLRREGGAVIDPGSYARYDAFADAVSSVDARAAAKVYWSLHTVLELAYRALGYPEGSLDAVTARALHGIAGAPVVEGDVEVEERDGVFVFRDERLEAAREVDKHLLRMGPRNTRVVQAKARELLEALGLPTRP
jgi:hypothetical protein